MRKMSKVKGLMFDAAVLVAVLASLSLACQLGSWHGVDTAHAAGAHPMVQAKITLQSVAEF